MCRHLILDVFFDVNKHQIEQMGATSKSPQSSSSKTNMPSLDTLQSKKDVQECMREVQRIFKSIVKESGNVIETSSDQSPTAPSESDSSNQKIMDDLHVIICMNKLL